MPAAVVADVVLAATADAGLTAVPAVLAAAPDMGAAMEAVFDAEAALFVAMPAVLLLAAPATPLVNVPAALLLAVPATLLVGLLAPLSAACLPILDAAFVRAQSKVHTRRASPRDARSYQGGSAVHAPQ